MGILPYVLLVVFVATLIRSTFGFGEALVAVPLLALRLPIPLATPLAALLSVTVGLVVLAQDWRQVHFRSAGWWIVSTLFGIPLGLLLLTSPHPTAIKVALALVIGAFALYSLLGARGVPARNERRAGMGLRGQHAGASTSGTRGNAALGPAPGKDKRRWLLLSGFTAGVLGGAYGMNGPPLAAYGALRQWTPQHFRATLQAYFLPASLIGLAGYWYVGLWVPAVTRDYLASLPVALPAIFLGRSLNRALRGPAFVRYVYFGLLLLAGLLLLQALL